MYKMVIADDEVMVCQYLHHVIEQNHLPFDICGEANNGQDALKLVDRYNPEFVILDINMPIMTGLEAAKRIRENHPDTIIYMLTAYRQFDYIQDAMHAAVFDYLVKPIKSADLVEILKKGLSHALKQRISSLQHQRLTKQATENYPLIVKQQLSDILTDEHDSAYVLKILRGIAHKASFQPTVLISIAYWNSIETKKNRLEKQLIQEYFQSFQDSAIIFPQGGEIVCICSVWNNQLQTLLHQQLQTCERDYHLTFCAGIATVEQPSQLSKAYNQACQKWKLGLFWRYQQDTLDFLIIDSVKEISDSIVSYNSTIKTIEREILSNEPQKAKLSFKQLFDDMKEDFCQPEFVRTTIARVACNLIDKCGEYTLADTDVDSLQKKAIHQIKDMSNVIEIEKFTLALLSQLTDHSESKEKNAEKTAKWAVSYIDNNYEKEITLEQIAAELFVSTSYLCRIFKKHTGKRYAAYLTDVRMKKAKELLCTEKFTVTEVARMVGFNDASYFSSVFKKYYNQAPSTLITTR